MLKHFMPLAFIAGLMLAGCEKTPSESAQDVAEVRQDANLKVGAARDDADKTISKADDKLADAQQDYAKADHNALDKLAEAESAALIKAANAKFDVAKAEAEGRGDIAKEKCGVLDGVENDACLSSADATLAADLAAAVANRDAALMAAARHE